MITKITHRSKKFGWGYSVDSIKLPVSPNYTGTISKVWKAKKEDVEYQNLEGALCNTQWFFDGEPIISISEDGLTTFGKNRWHFIKDGDIGLYLLSQFKKREIRNLYVRT